jgi:hypothetical protein
MPRPILRLLLLGLVVLAAGTQLARGDGGSVRLSERVGPYQITVFTSPTPFQAGPVDISVLVQDGASGMPVPDARVIVRLSPVDEPSAGTEYPATSEVATNKLLYAAKFDLPEPGKWRVDVEVQAGAGTARTGFEVEVAGPPPRWREMVFWIALPAVPILVFVVYQVLTRGSRKPFPAG